jgi:hypothetical protein
MSAFTGRVFGWPAAVGLLVAAICTELLPVIFGTGESATWDWGALYVTSRFVVLPLAALIHVVVNVGFALKKETRSSERVVTLLSLTISLGYLVSLYAAPLPWFVRP